MVLGRFFLVLICYRVKGIKHETATKKVQQRGYWVGKIMMMDDGRDDGTTNCNMKHIAESFHLYFFISQSSL